MKRVIALAMIATMLVVKPCSTNATETYIDYCEEIVDKYNICPEQKQAIVEKESN